MAAQWRVLLEAGATGVWTAVGSRAQNGSAAG